MLLRKGLLGACVCGALLLAGCDGGSDASSGRADDPMMSRGGVSTAIVQGDPDAGDPITPGACDGTPGQWEGCRGNGCAVCAEFVANYNCYFRNHPACALNSTCGGFVGPCNDNCPQPTAADVCPPPEWCGNYVCNAEAGEDCHTCPSDCGLCGG
jgi:hypothetical protein